MKAKFVYEGLEFERGKDPKDALGVGLAATGKMVIPAGKYEVWLWYYPSSYARQKKTNKFIDVAEQVVDYDASDQHRSDEGYVQVYARPDELKSLQQVYDRRSPDGGGHYFIWVPDPLKRTEEEYLDSR